MMTYVVYRQSTQDIYLLIHYYLCAVITLFVLRQCHRVVRGQRTRYLDTHTQHECHITIYTYALLIRFLSTYIAAKWIKYLIKKWVL